MTETGNTAQDISANHHQGIQTSEKEENSLCHKQSTTYVGDKNEDVKSKPKESKYSCHNLWKLLIWKYLFSKQGNETGDFFKDKLILFTINEQNSHIRLHLTWTAH